jgi:hypothetical protein
VVESRDTPHETIVDEIVARLRDSPLLDEPADDGRT